MITEEHLDEGDGPPTKAPTASGQHYLNRLTKEIYISRGKTTLADWGPVISRGSDEDVILTIIDAFETVSDQL